MLLLKLLLRLCFFTFLVIFLVFFCISDISVWTRLELPDSLFLDESYCSTFLLFVRGQVCAEWWAGEIVALFVGVLGTVQLAGFVILMNIAVIVWQISASFSTYVFL